MAEYNLGCVVGSDGNGIASIELYSTSGKNKTYRIIFTNGDHFDFTVTDGDDGSGTVVDTELSSSSTNPVQNKVITTALNGKANTSHNHDSRYYTETEIDTKLDDKADSIHTHSISDVNNLQTSLDGKANTSHTHDDRYYTESEIDTALSTKADSNTIPTKTSDLTNDGADGTNVFVANNDTRLSNARTPTSHASTETTYGLGTATIYGHVKTINRLSSTSYVAGEALSAYQGRALRDMINEKINTSDIADNLTTNDATKVLSAKQGKALNDLIGTAIQYINQ